MIRVILLGGVSVVDRDGRACGIASRRHPIGLLALLATAPSMTLSRGKLVGLLWPEVPERTARNRLTSCVYEVRVALGSAALVAAGDELRLDDAAFDCDVCQLMRAAAAMDHERVVSLYTGPYLDGFYLPASSPFEERVQRERDRLRWSYHASLEALASQAAERADLQEAVRLWRRRAADDPYDTRVATELAAALNAAGNRMGAMRVAKEHAVALEEELGSGSEAAFHQITRRLGTATVEGGAAPRHTSSGEDAVPSPRSIAVLPLEVIGASEEAGLFAIGLEADLLTELSRNPALTVIARAAVARYARGGRSLPDMARELGVGTVVDGTVRSVDGRIRLSVQLIDVPSGRHRWADRYERDLRAHGLFVVQDELAVRIARTLDAELAPHTRPRDPQESTSDLEALRLYTQGRALLDQRTRHEMTRAIAYFQRAIDRDAAYALAWTGLADAVSLLEFYAYEIPSGVPTALESATRAVELAPELGQAHASLGIFHAVRQRGPAAVRALEHGVTLTPSHAEAHVWLGWVHLMRGYRADGLEPARRGVELDPLAPAYRAYFAEILLANGELERARLQAERACAIQPEYALAHVMHGLVLYHLRHVEPARRAFERARSLALPEGMPRAAEIDAFIAVSAVAAGDRTTAASILARIEPARYPFASALVRAALGRVDDALDDLERVHDWGSFANESVRYLFPDVLAPVRRHARFGVVERALALRWNDASDPTNGPADTAP